VDLDKTFQVRSLCLYPYRGAESIYRLVYYEVLLTNPQYEWKSIDDVTRAEIKSGAVKGGSDRYDEDTLYICVRRWRTVRTLENIPTKPYATSPGAARSIFTRLTLKFCSGKRATTLSTNGSTRTNH
jgi:hypothetical protein